MPLRGFYFVSMGESSHQHLLSSDLGGLTAHYLGQIGSHIILGLLFDHYTQLGVQYKVDGLNYHHHDRVYCCSIVVPAKQFFVGPDSSL